MEGGSETSRERRITVPEEGTGLKLVEETREKVDREWDPGTGTGDSDQNRFLGWYKENH